MKQTAVECLIEQIETLIENGYVFFPKFEEDLIEQVKELEKEQQAYSEEEVIQFGKFLTEFNNLDNEIECAIKKLLKQFKNK